MKILTMHTGHNATVTLAKDGEIIGVLSQEKCDNIKNSAKFPSLAIEKLFAEVGWNYDDIDKILISGLTVYPPNAYEYLYDKKNRIIDKSPIYSWIKRIRNSHVGKSLPFIFNMLRSYRRRNLENQGYFYLLENLKKLGFHKDNVEFVEHHLCHARCAYHSFTPSTKTSTPSLVFTLDGSGDDLCATVTQVDSNGNWSRIAKTPSKASLGGIYSNTTRFLGMKILEHEYKVMGLAPYTKREYMLDVYERIFKPAIWLSKSNTLVFESNLNTANFYNYLADHAVGERFDNVAAALQHLTEELVMQWVRNAIKQTGIRRIYTGGGVFMNVKLNQRIQEMPEVEKVFFMPSCGDESNPIGAYYDFARRNDIKTKPLDNLYLGISFSNAEIEQYLNEKKLHKQYDIVYYDNIENEIAELLTKGKVIARFAERCEWGARSLGNRAILAHPSYMESFYTVNDYIKSRDFWMPFAPSILDTAATKYLKNYNPKKVKAPHMITAFFATDAGLKDLRAALHQGDHTLRPQVLEEHVNPRYYKLIKHFEKLTGVGGVLNTSFNLHGYPLVADLEQAVMTLEHSELKYLALENFMVIKR